MDSCVFEKLKKKIFFLNMDLGELLIILKCRYWTDFERPTIYYSDFVYWKKWMISPSVILKHEMRVGQDLHLWLRLKLLWSSGWEGLRDFGLWSVHCLCLVEEN